MEILKDLIKQGLRYVDENTCKDLISSYGIEIPKKAFVKSKDELLDAANKIGFPVVLKVVSNEILHKTEISGVKVGIKDEDELVEAFSLMDKNCKEKKIQLLGYLVEEVIEKGYEMIVGLSNDPQFGPVMMLGTGGIFIELFEDVTFRVIPVERRDVLEMLSEIKGAKILEGYRGLAQIDKEKLIQTILNISKFGMDIAPYFESVDFNPIVVSDKKICVLDAKIVLRDRILENPISLAEPDITYMDGFFSPKSVAVVGASATPGKIGYVVLDSVANHDFKGKVFPISKRRDEIFGIKTYKDLSDVPEAIDLVVGVVDLALVPEMLEVCKDKGVHNVLLISGGGKELGGERAKIEAKIRELSKEYKIRIIGPNCIGAFNSKTRFDAFFQNHERLIRPKSGPISFITQSGTYGCSFLELAAENPGISKMVSYGNRVDVDEADLIKYLSEDDGTKVIAVYVEGLGDARKFVRTARAIKDIKKKPVVVFKTGRTKISAEAAVSHTGAFGGSYKIYEGAFRQFGIVPVDGFLELFAASKALSMQPAPKGERVAIVSNGAGPVVNAFDFFDEKGLKVAKLSRDIVKEMREHFPFFYIVENPVDVTGSATADDYRFVIERFIRDENVDIIMPWFVFQDTPLGEEIAKYLAELNKISTKPILCGAIGGPFTKKMKKAIEDGGVPLFESVEEWVCAASAMAFWGKMIS